MISSTSYMMIASALSAVAVSRLQAQSSRGSVDQVGSPLRGGIQPVSLRPVAATDTSPEHPTSASSPQLSSVAESSSPALQLTGERGAGPASQQLTRGLRSAQSSHPLSLPKDGRTAAVERIAGTDRCDPAAADRSNPATCAQVIELRAAEFTRRGPPPLSPEQRIIVEQQLRERSGSFGGAARRLATKGDDAQSLEAQGVASVVLGAPPTKPGRDQPADDPAATEQMRAIINAIVNQTPPQ